MRMGLLNAMTGTFYPDINMVWTRDMDESEFGLVRDSTNYVPKKSGTVAITDNNLMIRYKPPLDR